MSYNKWKSLAKRKGTEASIVWVREAQTGVDSCDKGMDNEKPHSKNRSKPVRSKSQKLANKKGKDND